MATLYLRAIFILICFLNINLLLKCMPRYFMFLLVLISCPCIINSFCGIGSLLFLKIMAFILAGSISSLSFLVFLASLLASLSVLDRTCFNNLPKAFTAMLSVYLYLCVFFLLCKTGLSSRLNSIGNTGNPWGRLSSSLNSVPDISFFFKSNCL